MQDEEFVVVVEKGIAPHTRHVRGSNCCLLNVFEDRISGRAIIISVVGSLHSTQNVEVQISHQCSVLDLAEQWIIFFNMIVILFIYFVDVLC